MTTALHQLPAIVLAFITLAALLAIGALIWQALPRRNARERDIERQIATLRKSADHAVATRPRVQKSTKRRISLLRLKRLLAVREAKKRIAYSPDVRAAFRRSRRSSAALGKTILEYERLTASKAEKPKACGGGQCRHRADCADTYCPGRLSASLTGTKARHARR